jgi:predicted dithiol-disulfide oxidoreductase (DUF899 family)/pimeloyl-ACP methyl ester carboxylesterase
VAHERPISAESVFCWTSGNRQEAALRKTDVTLHGHRVAYRVAGDPALPVLLLVHGITSTSATWDPVIPALAERAHVIAPDLLGHGDSDKPRGDYSLGAFASGLRDLLHHLGHEQVTVVGHSLGGGVAMQLAYQYPEHCDRLVLVSSGGLGRDVSWALRAATLPGAEYLLPVIANTHVRTVGHGVGRLLHGLRVRARPSMVELARGYATLADSPARSAFVHTLRSVVEPGGQRVNANDRLYLAEGRPTLIVWGALDTVIPVAHAHIAHAAMPGSELEIFEQSEHFPHMDEPGRFTRALLSFLATSRPAPIDRAMLRERMTTHSRLLRDQGIEPVEPVDRVDVPTVTAVTAVPTVTSVPPIPLQADEFRPGGESSRGATATVARPEGNGMNLPEIVSREQWLVARKELLAEEKALTRQRDALNARRRELPMVRIEQEYVFAGPAGPTPLLELFEGRSQLIIYHFMFDPSWDDGCGSCTAGTDELSPKFLEHLHVRDTSYAMVSRAPLAKLERWKALHGWQVPWYSSFGTSFNVDFGVTIDASAAPPQYNYRSKAEFEATGSDLFNSDRPFEMPGRSCFLQVDGEIFHTYSQYARGLESTGGSYYFLDLTALGRQEEWEEPRGRTGTTRPAVPDFTS